MSIAAHRYVSAMLDRYTAAQLNTTCRSMLRELADMADADGVAWPGTALLARRVGVTPANIRRWTRHITGLGIMAVDVSRGGARGATNTYRFPVQAFDSLSTPRAPARPLESADPARQRALPRAPARVTPRGGARRISKEPCMNRDAPDPCSCGQSVAPGRWRCAVCQEMLDRDGITHELIDRYRNRAVI